MSVAWIGNPVEQDRAAFAEAKRAFIEHEEREPETTADFSAILRRATAILQSKKAVASPRGQREGI